MRFFYSSVVGERYTVGLASKQLRAGGEPCAGRVKELSCYTYQELGAPHN